MVRHLLRNPADARREHPAAQPSPLASLSERDGLVSLSMADAFLLAGAARVVAPNRKIDDRDTSRLMHALYRRDEPDLGSALTAVQRELYQAEDPMDWSAFRVITR